jgi:hypothetical protein
MRGTERRTGQRRLLVLLEVVPGRWQCVILYFCISTIAASISSAKLVAFTDRGINLSGRAG